MASLLITPTATIVIVQDVPAWVVLQLEKDYHGVIHSAQVPPADKFRLAEQVVKRIRPVA